MLILKIVILLFIKKTSAFYRFKTVYRSLEKKTSNVFQRKLTVNLGGLILLLKFSYSGSKYGQQTFAIQFPSPVNELLSIPLIKSNKV